jgi:hypothetical protein
MISYSFGPNVKDNKTPLIEVSSEDVVNMVKTGAEGIAETTTTLRKIVKYSKEHYRNMKTQLPFVACSTFDNGIRKYENFKHATGWVIDIDSEQILPLDIKEKLYGDSRVYIGFVSPNGMGLKLFFRFEQPYVDKVNYGSAYKTFTQEFAIKYGIMDKIDLKNCDVSRVCFLCHDKECYYNEDAIAIDPSQYISSLFSSEIMSIEHQANEKQPSLSDEEYRNVLARLGSKPRPIQSRPFVPNEVIKVIEPLKIILEENAIEIIKSEEIQFGMKLYVRCNKDCGEVIVYHGKQGYKVVTSPKKGNHHALNEIVKQIIEYYLYTAGNI